MDKTVVIGDLHGLNTWERILDKESPDKVVFLGDYFDSYEISVEDQVRNFMRIFSWKKENPNVKVITLIGNHDIHYFPYINDTSTSGFSIKNKFIIGHLLSQYSDSLLISYQEGYWLFSHAGVSEEYLNMFIPDWECDKISFALNELFYYKPNSFLFNAAGNCNDPYGDDKCQSPIWIRPKSLMTSNKKSVIKRDLIQVVGHTQQTCIDMGKSTGGRYFFTDTMPIGEYLIIEDNVPRKGKL